MIKLTEKQRVFVNEYLIDLNATRAYKKAYINIKNDETARANASRLLTKANVKEYVEQRMRDREERTEITQDKVIKELAAIAFTSGADFAKVVEKSYIKPIKDKEGNVIDEEEVFYKDVDVILTDDIPEIKKKAISAIKSTKYGVSVESYDKVKALELLGKHLGMFKEQVEVSGNINNPYEGLTEEQLLELAKGD